MACGVHTGMFNARPGRYIYNERNDNRPPVAHAPGNAEQELIACAQQQSKRQSLTRYLSERERTSSVPITHSCAHFPPLLRQRTIPRRPRGGPNAPTQLLRKSPSTTCRQRQPCKIVPTYCLPFPWPPGASPAPGGSGFNSHKRNDANRQCRPRAQLHLRPRP